MTNPYIPPSSDLGARTLSSDDAEAVCEGQKLIIYAIVANFVAGAFSKTSEWLGVAAALVAVSMGITGLLKIAKGMDVSTARKVMIGLLMLVPVVNLITMMVVNSRATKLLRDAGYKVGLMGASK
jgi:hypothetical protein